MANYFVISRAKPKPGYAATGLKHLKTLADFTKENGAVHCDVGVQQTGANAGSLIAAMFVEKMATIENIFDHFQLRTRGVRSLSVMDAPIFLAPVSQFQSSRNRHSRKAN